MNKIKKLSALLGAMSMAFVMSTAAQADSPNGTWLRAKVGTEISVYDCKEGLGMKVAKAKKAGTVGKEIVCGAKAVSKTKWKGNLLNLEDGQKYSGHFELIDANTLKVSGCVLGGVVCKTEKWTRVK